MAAATLPGVGTKLGPCSVPCSHKDCECTRRMAESICPYCRKPIGYETRFYEEDHEAGILCHATCLEEWNR